MHSLCFPINSPSSFHFSLIISVYPFPVSTMAKLTVLVATFIALLLVVDASIYRATVIIDDGGDDAENQPRKSCSREIQQAQNLRDCEEHIRRTVKGQRGAEDEIENKSDQFQRCCNQLQQMDSSQCRCEGLSQAVRRLQSKGKLQGQDVQKAYRTAETLTSQCHVSPRQCQMQPSWSV
ncbi:hypothetical protein MANES_15G075900v8 [Manihot esculenta]|uniref:Uncharacterized protein n=1 Tax=Manihot esculenta TaxID=3983 RepID=A0ACB7G9W8_MANES|nr:hypothetical protein MANES_15G075900v8 [Manihot esculenta]